MLAALRRTLPSRRANMGSIWSTVYFSTMNLLSGNMHAEPGLKTYGAGAGYFIVRTQGTPKQLTMRELITSRCPSLMKEFRPAWWLPNGHLQTFYCVLGDFSKVDKVVYDRKYLRLKGGATIGIDFTPSTEDQRSYKEDTPVIVVVHGLTGGSHESYVRSVLAPACTPVEQGGLGYRGVVLNFRGCAGTPITSPQLYSAYHTDDLRQVLMYLTTLYPKAPFLGIGFSLGANVIVRYLAEEGARSRLKSGCALGCPWNLSKNNQRLEEGWFYQRVYARTLGGNLVKMFQRHAETLKQWPEHPVARVITEIEALKGPPLIGDFDQMCTRIMGGSMGPHGPFPFVTNEDYYAAASTDGVLHSVGVPLLAVNAGDDPIVRSLPESLGDSPFVALMTTNGGGHLGWFSGRGLFGARRWVTQPVLEWFKATAEDLISPSITMRRIYEGDGWTTEEGREHLGVKVVEGVERVVGVDGEEGLLQGL